MDKAVAIAHCADALKMFGRYETGSDANYLPMKMLFAFQEICRRKPWSWKRTTATITTTQGVNGGYALPADFDLLTVKESIKSTYADEIATFPVLLDASGKAVDCVLRRSDNTLFFKNDPSNSIYTLSYIPKITLLDQISLMPDDMLDVLCELSKSYALGDDENTIGMSNQYYNSFERKIDKYWVGQRKGQTLQSSRVPVGELGVRFDSAIKYDAGLP